MGVAMAVAYYTLKGYTVSYPLTDNARYDLVVENRTLSRVQCKTTRFIRDGRHYVAKLSTSGGNRSWSGVTKYLSAEECDLLFVFTFDGRCYEFGPEIFDGKGMIVLSPDKDAHVVWTIPLPSESLRVDSFAA
jgi:hypothetical protein